MEKVTKNMAEEKFIKGVASMNNVVQSLVEGGPAMAGAAIALEIIKPVLEAFAPLIEMLQSPMEVLSGIFQMALLPTIQAMAPLVSNFNIMLIQNKDAIIAVITVMSPMMIGLKILTVIMTENRATIIEVQNAFGELISVTGELINIILEDEDAMYVLKIMAQGLSVELKAIVIVIRTVADGVRSLKNLLNDLKNMMASIRLPSLGGGGGGGGGGSSGNLLGDVVSGLLGMREGGIATAPTITRLAEDHKPEAVLPLDRLEAMMSHADPELLYLTQSNNNKLDMLIELNKGKNRTIY